MSPMSAASGDQRVARSGIEPDLTIRAKVLAVRRTTLGSRTRSSSNVRRISPSPPVDCQRSRNQYTQPPTACQGALRKYFLFRVTPLIAWRYPEHSPWLQNNRSPLLTFRATVVIIWAMNDNDIKHLWATRIRYILDMRGWRQEDLADLLGVRRQMVSRWLLKRDIPSRLRQEELRSIEEKIYEEGR